MQTVQRLIKRAYEKLQVGSQYEALSSEDERNGIDELNEMMWEMDAAGVSIGWNDVSSSSENVPAPDWMHGTILNGLVIRLAPYFGYHVDPRVIESYQSGIQTALKQLVPVPTVNYPDILPTGGSRTHWQRDRFFHNNLQNASIGQAGYARDQENNIINSKPDTLNAESNT